nr:2-oxoglutarate (2OG) and Fe(II)-dependent oxygenase superfamily protein [Tanacetum cinerariifolium]
MDQVRLSDTKSQQGLWSWSALGRKHDGEKFKELFANFIELLGVFSVGDYIPWMSWVLDNENPVVEIATELFDAFLEGVIEEHVERNIQTSGSNDDENKDFVDILLDIQNENDANFVLDRDTVKALIWVVVMHQSITVVLLKSSRADPSHFCKARTNQQTDKLCSKLVMAGNRSLQFLFPRGVAITSKGWIEIPPVHGALVINIGDALQIISNGRYKSAEHRVRTTSVESRVSVPIFNGPLPMVKIGPLPEVVARDGVARYRELIFEEYMNNFFGKSHDGKKSLDFAAI